MGGEGMGVECVGCGVCGVEEADNLWAPLQRPQLHSSGCACFPHLSHPCSHPSLVAPHPDACPVQSCSAVTTCQSAPMRLRSTDVFATSLSLTKPHPPHPHSTFYTCPHLPCSVTMLEDIVAHSVAALSPAGPGAPLASIWADTSLRWALHCRSRHFSCRCA
eukprot:705-Chlamydomonas_euryale.AAC.2